MALETRRARPVTLLLVALVFFGILAMHGFEAVLHHPGHWSADGHRPDVAASAAETHVSHGGCDLDGAKAAGGPDAAACTVGSVAHRTALPHAVEGIRRVLANRDVLTAFSILRI